MCPNVCERRHEVRTGRGEKGLSHGRTRSKTRQARWPECHRQGNAEGRHAFRSGSHRVEISIRFDLTLESVPAFRLFSRRTAHAFGTIGASIGCKHRYVKALRASWTLASAPAHGRKLPRVSSDISAEGGTDSKGFDDWFFARRIENHSDRARQGRCPLSPRPRLAAFENPQPRPASQESDFLARRDASIVEGVGQAIAPDKAGASRKVAREHPAKSKSWRCFRFSDNPKEERTLNHAHDAASFFAGHPRKCGERSTESTAGPGQAFGRCRQAWRACDGLLTRSDDSSLPTIQGRRRNRCHGKRPERQGQHRADPFSPWTYPQDVFIGEFQGADAHSRHGPARHCDHDKAQGTDSLRILRDRARRAD